MRFAVLSHENSGNFGDEIQSIAAARLLPRVDLTIPRERLRDFSADEKTMLVMNGFFDRRVSFPPAECIAPLYISFHIAPDAKDFFTTPECIAHFNRHAPIGCRDRGTMEILRAAGVDAFYSKCLTLTFAKRQPAQAGGIVLCDVPENGGIISAKRLRRLMGKKNLSARTLTHLHGIDGDGNEIKTRTAECLLSLYRVAGLVVTSRLHCALPCVAMGVPVLYFGVSESRTSILSDVGITMHSPLMPSARSLWQRWREAWRFRGFDWTGESPNVEAEKQNIIAAFQKKLAPFL